jgi:hypothetical protein
MFRGLAVGFILVAMLIPGNAGAKTSSLVAADRCNGRMINDYSGQIRNDDAHPPRSDPANLEKRFDDISQVLAGLDQERGILDAMCSTDAQKTPYFTLIGATAAWALALQSDIASKLGMPCAAGSSAFSQTLLAQGWLDLASIVNGAGGAVPSDVAEVEPKVRSRAAALGLTLPSYAQASDYWRDGIAAQAKTAVEACPGLKATPQPFTSPLPTTTPNGVLRIVRK